ncbi:hypothetical protein KC316_g2467 [Hortaea werneckii]|nr:hypothetical protein KC324_g1880 [Hortaea werneckii]KAI7592142.1 hypothetical protein KC316_g2467 [Hortaea werneckii]
MSNQYNPSTFQELEDLRRQVQEQEQQLRELEAQKTLSDVAQALLGAAAKTALQSYPNGEIKAEAEGINAVETSEAQGTASHETIKALEERLMGMTLSEFKDFINKLVPQATTKADGSIEG